MKKHAARPNPAPDKANRRDLSGGGFRRSNPGRLRGIEEPESGRYLYQALAQRLERAIREQKLRPHAPFLSHREVEKAYGSNNITVAKAMAHLVERGVLYAIPYKGCFISPMVKNRKILFVGDEEVLSGRQVDFLDFFFSAQGQMETAEAPFEIVPIGRARFFESAGELRQRYPDLTGLVVFRNPAGLSALSPLAGELPMVFFGGRSRAPALRELPWFSKVFYDEHQVGSMVLKHLMELGHRRLGVLYEADFVVTAAMAQGFQGAARKILKQGVLAMDWPTAPGGAPIVLEREKLRLWLESLTAVFCTSDAHGARLIQLAREWGLSIPEKLSVAGVNDSPLCRDLVPSMSSVRLISPQAVSAVLKPFLHGETRPFEKAIPAIWAPRDSTARAGGKGVGRA